MSKHNVLKSAMTRRQALRGAAGIGLGAIAAPYFGGSGAIAQDVSCPPPATPAANVGTPEAMSGKKIGVSVAYLSVPFYANFKTGLADGAKRFGFEYELRDGGGGDLAKEVAVLQDFIAKKVDLILLTPSGEGIIPGIKQVNDAGIPVIEVNNRAGFQSGQADVVTYVGADDVEFGRLQGKLLIDTLAGAPAKVGYEQGISGTSPQILRGQGFNEAIKDHPEIEVVATVTNDFSSSKALAVTQDLLTRFPKGSLDFIVMQGPDGVPSAQFARENGREEVRFILGDYPADVRQAIIDGYIFGTINQDPYPQAFEAMHMAWLYFNGRESEIPKPYFLDLPIITKENAEATPPAWGC
ncbi:MAG TPA: sugar ABC transporter substrate-binding protein [Nitrospira sp.]|jgi:ribose transport system substrate-binding protein|nr:sugar ABC transporter substrate-binding protein [Thermomicrobiales bacterium]HEX5544208.1 sugar ABC transporter substrate-binding protein [Nitrospira sp.]